MWSLIIKAIGLLIGLFTGKTANRDEELGTQKAENKQLRDDIDTIKRTDDAVKKEQIQGGRDADPDDLDAVQHPPAGGL